MLFRGLIPPSFGVNPEEPLHSSAAGSGSSTSVIFPVCRCTLIHQCGKQWGQVWSTLMLQSFFGGGHPSQRSLEQSSALEGWSWGIQASNGHCSSQKSAGLPSSSSMTPGSHLSPSSVLTLHLWVSQLYLALAPPSSSSGPWCHIPTLFPKSQGNDVHNPHVWPWEGARTRAAVPRWFAEQRRAVVPLHSYPFDMLCGQGPVTESL